MADDTVAEVRSLIRPGDRVMVTLDSNHTKAHVAAELERYAPLVTPGSYCVVFDSVMTMVSDAPNGKPGWDQTTRWRPSATSSPPPTTSRSTPTTTAWA